MKYTLKGIFLFFFIIIVIPLWSQFDDRPPQQFEDFEDRGSLQADSTGVESNSFFDIFTGKPGKAAFYSLVCPGAGQFYNKRYWKVPIIIGGEVAAFYWLFWNHSQYNKWNAGYLGLLNEQTPFVPVVGGSALTDVSRVKAVRDNYLKNREYAYIIVILAHLFNTFEAFIDRHLIDFDTSDDLSFKLLLEPSLMGSQMAGITLSIPLNKSVKKKKPIDFFGANGR